MNNRSNRSEIHWRLALFALMTSGLCGYLILYLAQPSLFALQDESGQPHKRLIDLLVLPSLLSGVWGEGQRPLGISDRIPLLVGAVGWLSCAWYIGSAITRRLGIAAAKPAQQHSVEWRIILCSTAVLLGLSWLSTLVLVLGVAGLLGSRWPLAAGVMVSLIAAWRVAPRRRVRLRDVLSSILPPGRAFPRERSHRQRAPQKIDSRLETLQFDNQFARWGGRLVPVSVLGLASLYLLGAMLPPWEFDVLEYHLQAPKEFAQHGDIGFVPHNVYANMPLGAEMHALAAMVLVDGERGWWTGGLIGKTIIGCISLILTAMVGAWSSMHLGRFAGWTAAGFTLASVGHAHETTSGLIDMVLATYMFATLVWLQVLRTESLERNFDWSAMLCIGLLSGAAAACKYPGIVLVMLPTAASMAILTRQQRSATRLRSALTGIATGWAITLGPWLIKNWFLTGNPVYPLLGNLLGAPGMEAEAIERWNRAHSPWAASDSPFDLAQALQSTSQLLISSPFLNPVLMVLIIFGCVLAGWRLVIKRDESMQYPLPEGIWWWLWVLIVWWGVTHRIDRFWLPVLPLMALHAAWSARWIALRVSSSLAVGVVLLGISLAFFLIAAGAGPVQNQFFVRLDAQERETLELTPGSIVNPVIPWINQTLSKRDRVLLIGEVKAYLFRVPILYATCFNPPPGRAWLAGEPPGKQWESLRSHNVTHVLVDWAEVDRYRSPGNYGFSSWPEREDIQQMVDDGVLVRLATPFDPADVDILAVSVTRPSTPRP